MGSFTLWVLLIPTWTVWGQVKQVSDPVDNPSKTNLYIMGLACFSGPRLHGTYMKPASEMALDLVNTREDILPEYKLNVIWIDTEVRSDVLT